MSLGDVRHQDRALRQLQRALSSRRMPHAFLFHGPVGVGKELTAIGLAELLLCTRPVVAEGRGDGSPVAVESADAMFRQGCGSCDDCRAVRADTHPDLHIIHRRLNREHREAEVRKRKSIEISVDVVRQFVIERVGLTPSRGRAKVFVIQEAERMSASAQNALLKTLEEPPGTTFITLLAGGLEPFLPTTISRCQSVAFGRLPAVFVAERLAALRPGTPAATLAWCAAYGDGGVGAALEALDDGLFQVRERVAETLDRDRDLDDAAIVKTLIEVAGSLGDLHRQRDPEISDGEATRRGVKAVLSVMAWNFAERLRDAAQGPGTATGGDTRPAPGSRAARARPPEADIIRRIALAQHHLEANAHTQLVVEALLIDIARTLEHAAGAQ